MQLRLAVELDSEPITGWVGGSDREPHAFTGWMELATAIEDARRGPDWQNNSEMGKTAT